MFRPTGTCDHPRHEGLTEMKTVLIVEDNAADMKLFMTFSRPWLQVFCRPARGWRRCASPGQHRPDLIVMEHSIAEVSGLE